MGANSKIEWTTHTWNPWRGCQRVSEACRHCYAEAQAKRNPGTLGVWGPNGTRVIAAEKAWLEPLAWDRQAKAAGVRPRVFCASMADVFEDWGGQVVNHKGGRLWWHPTDPRREARVCENKAGSLMPHEDFEPYTLNEARQRLFALIHQTPHLDWLLLTKRPENILRFAGCNHCQGPWKPPHEGTDRCVCGGTQGFPPNVWLGTTVEDRQHTDRIDVLRQIPAAVRFLSVEPLLEDLGTVDLAGIHWVIAGGESGHGARPMHPDWARSLRDQCQAAGVAFHFKQWGEHVPYEHDAQPPFLTSQHGDTVDGHLLPHNLTDRVNEVLAGGWWMDDRHDLYRRVGKKAAGRLLDGEEYSEFPAATA